MSSGDDGVAINLVHAQVGGALFFDKAAPKHTTDSTRRLEVDGLTYTGVPEPCLPRTGGSYCRKVPG